MNLLEKIFGNKEPKSLEELRAALQEEGAKEKVDTEKVLALIDAYNELVMSVCEEGLFTQEQVDKAVADATEGLKTQEEVDTAIADASTGDDSARIAELEEELESFKMKASDPANARLHAINGGKSLKLTIMEDDQHFAIEARFTVPTFSMAKFGDMKSADVVANPERYQQVIGLLIKRQSSLLVIESKKKVKAPKN